MKEKLVEKCKHDLEEKVSQIKDSIAELKESMGSDTKSSAGDKYETGREMMNQEKEKLMSQLAMLSRHLETLYQIDLQEKPRDIGFGSLVDTSAGTFFISISLGNIKVDGHDVYMISAITPIAKAMIEKKVGDKFEWRDQEVEIFSIW